MIFRYMRRTFMHTFHLYIGVFCQLIIRWTPHAAQPDLQLIMRLTILLIALVYQPSKMHNRSMAGPPFYHLICCYFFIENV